MSTSYSGECGGCHRSGPKNGPGNLGRCACCEDTTVRFTTQQMKQERRRAAKNAVSRVGYVSSVKRFFLILFCVAAGYAAGYYTPFIKSLFEKLS